MKAMQAMKAMKAMKAMQAMKAMKAAPGPRSGRRKPGKCRVGEGARTLELLKSKIRMEGRREGWAEAKAEAAVELEAAVAAAVAATSGTVAFCMPAALQTAMLSCSFTTTMLAEARKPSTS